MHNPGNHIDTPIDKVQERRGLDILLENVQRDIDRQNELVKSFERFVLLSNADRSDIIRRIKDSLAELST